MSTAIQSLILTFSLFFTLRLSAYHQLHQEMY